MKGRQKEKRIERYGRRETDRQHGTGIKEGGEVGYIFLIEEEQGSIEGEPGSGEKKQW